MSTLGSTAPMFSYAQAAKGLAPTAQVSSTTTSSTSSEQGNRDVQSLTTDAQSQQTKLKSTSNAMDTSPAKQLSNGSLSTDKTEENNKPKIDGKESMQSTQKLDNDTVVDSDLAAVARDDALSPKASNGSVGIDKETKVTEQDLEKSIHSDDQEKGKDLDDDWEKVSVPSVAAEKELKVAPIPVVNIWQQRLEAQEAKMKESVVQRQTPAAPVPKSKPQSPPARDDSRRKSGAKDVGLEKDTSAQRRNNSGIRPGALERKEQSPSQLSPRSLSKQGDKSGSGFPATGDAESWPTPEHAVIDERRRSTTHEKAEKGDAKAANQKKWIQMPFVPTAKFETQLPPAATARRGGRASNRGRESSHRGSHNATSTQATEKNEVGSMGPPPPKQTAEQDRGRKGETSRNQRASSVPTSTGRPASNEANTSSFRKPSAAIQKDQADPTRAITSSQRAPHTVADESSVTDGSRSSSRQPTHGLVSTRKQEVDITQDVASPVVPEPTPRNLSNTERNRGNSRDEFRTSTDLSDRSFQTGREWSRGRPESTREKSDSWKERREPRGERARGNGYRGRGSHSNYNAHTQTYTAPLPQNGFESSKYPTEGRNRQASQPFGQSQSMQGARSNPRSQSIPVTVSTSSFFTPIAGFQQAISPVQGDLNYSNYPGQMPTGIMNAMPYADQLNSMALISMVITQLEYYFSINNLCKDVFLRKNMDSQGFVPLSVIAGFKRIQALTDGQMSHEQFRAVCQQAPHVEFVTSDSGEDKLRARNSWKDFILPIEERLPSAQNDGPSLRAQQRHQSNNTHNITGQGLPIRSPTAMNGFTEPFTPSMQGVSYPPVSPFDGSVPDSYPMRPDASQVEQARRSSATSPFGHTQSPTMQDLGRTSSYMSNGHHRSGSNIALAQNVFPDEKIPELKVVVRDTTFESSQSHTNSTTDPKSPKLRGGAGGHQQLESFGKIQFGQTSSDTEEEMSFWTKHGHIAKVPADPSFIHEDYLSLRHKAVAQRDDKHFDGALAVLYPFWSTFLVENFNMSMYQEFADFAADEAAAGSQNGQQHLLCFYEALLKRKVPISERIASDIVSLFHKERAFNDKGPVFETLRTALRNGATDFKTVKRIRDALTTEEKTELGV